LIDIFLDAGQALLEFDNALAETAANFRKPLAKEKKSYDGDQNPIVQVRPQDICKYMHDA
jgi:hypothetical protein